MTLMLIVALAAQCVSLGAINRSVEGRGMAPGVVVFGILLALVLQRCF